MYFQRVAGPCTLPRRACHSQQAFQAPFTLVASDAASFVTGSVRAVGAVDGGLTAGNVAFYHT